MLTDSLLTEGGRTAGGLLGFYCEDNEEPQNFFIVITILLSYWRYVETFFKFLQYIIFTLSIILLYPHPPPPFLEKFQHVSFFHFPA
jgi:hypothetical protein